MKMHISSSVLIVIAMVALYGCSQTEREPHSHYFLKGYDHLEFRDESGDVFHPSEYIRHSQVNGARVYEVQDTSLVLIDVRKERPYTGFIRTFHRHRYNIQGEFEEGKIFRLRFWYPNLTLGQDVDFRQNTGSVWNSTGMLAVNWNEVERFYLNPSTQTIRRIISDTLTSYFDAQGNLERYTIQTDTAFMQYYADGTPRFQFPVGGRGWDGKVRRWHPNGQLQAVGTYRNGRQVGVWVEYDDKGNVISSENYGDD